MDLPWGEKSSLFASSIGLITSTGKLGDNVMTCEWTHMISYKPGLIAVCIGPNKTTAENIRKTKEFGVNLCADDMSAFSSVAGNNHGNQVNKIKVLEELGFKFYQGKKIKARMIEGTVLNVECKLVEEQVYGDHILFVGEALEASVNENKQLMIYHKTKYWKLGENVLKLDEKQVSEIKKITEKHKNNLG